jgi:hypothetical protein
MGLPADLWDVFSALPWATILPVLFLYIMWNHYQPRLISWIEDLPGYDVVHGVYVALDDLYGVIKDVAGALPSLC